MFIINFIKSKMLLVGIVSNSQFSSKFLDFVQCLLKKIFQYVVFKCFFKRHSKQNQKICIGNGNWKHSLVNKIVILVVGLFLFVGNVQAEEIDNYSVNVKINKDATIDIVETIDYDFGDLQKHGISRNIPVMYDTGKGLRRSIKIKDIEIKVDNKPIKFKKKKSGSELKIKIGDENILITGKHKYEISYKVKGAINYFDMHDELYWNVIGSGWFVKIKKTFIKVEASNILKVEGFKGVSGSTESCGVISKENTREFQCGVLGVHEGATVVIGIDKGTIREPSFLEKILAMALSNWIIGLPVIVFVWMFKQWKKKGRDPKGRGVIIPYYDVVDNLSLGDVAYIIYGKLQSEKISAMIIQLAVKGFIKIKQIKKKGVFKGAEYIFTKTDKQLEVDMKKTSEEGILYDALFSLGKNNSVSTNDLKDKFYTNISDIKKNVLARVIKNKYLVNNPAIVIGKWIGIAFMLAFVVIMSSIFFQEVAVFAGILIFIIITGFGILMPRYTKKGVETKEKLLGFKLYLETAEKDRIAFHNAPEKKPEIFEKFLPYAMVFGVEKKWAEQFKDIYNQQPEWYSGAEGQVFNSVILANNLNAFNSVVSASLSSNPSSASSGGSGFSGGGSGGGFGGGGGGSW